MQNRVSVRTRSSISENNWVTIRCARLSEYLWKVCVCVWMCVCTSYNPWGLREVCAHSVFSCCFPLIPPVYTGNEPLLALTLPASSLLLLLPGSKSPDVGLLNTQRDQAVLYCCTLFLAAHCVLQPWLRKLQFEWMGRACLFKSTFEWPFRWNT